MSKFETIGPFELHPPIGGGSGWTMKRDDEWVPVTLDSRDTCIFFAGALTAGLLREDVEELRNTYNRAKPSAPVTLAHVLTALGY